MKNKRNKVQELAAILVFLVLSASSAYADAHQKEKEKEDNSNPIGCRNLGYQFQLKTLKLTPGKISDHQSLYLFFNQLNQPLTFFQMKGEDNSRSLYLNHIIGPRQWAILSTGEKQLQFICTIPAKKSQYGEVVSCSNSVRVCEYNHVKYGLNNRGNYWLVNSSTRNGAVVEIVHYGMIPGN